MLWEHEHMSPIFATVNKNWAKTEARARLRSHMQMQMHSWKNIVLACLINRMFKKIQVFPGLNPVIENIFMLQMKWSMLIACANLKALQHLAVFLIKVQFLKSQVKRSSLVESLHNYFGTWSWYLFQGFYGTCFLLWTSLVVSCLRCNGCPKKGALQLMRCIHQHESSPSTYKYLPEWVKTSAQNLQSSKILWRMHRDSECIACGHFSCPFANIMKEAASLWEKITSITCSPLQKCGNYLLFRR